MLLPPSGRDWNEFLGQGWAGVGGLQLAQPQAPWAPRLNTGAQYS